MMSGAALSMLDQGTRNFVLSLARRPLSQVSRVTGPNTEPDYAPLANNLRHVSQLPVVHEPLPLPAPTANGRIVLPASGRFLAADVSVRGTLEIVGDPTSPPEILIADRSLSLWAELIQLRHVRIVRQSDSDRSQPLIVTDCQQLEIVGCRFELDAAGSPTAAAAVPVRRRGAALAWRPQEPLARDRTRVTLHDVVFAGAGPAVFMDSPPATLLAENVLKVGAGDVVQLRDLTPVDWSCELRQITLRQTGPLLRYWPRKAGTSISRLTLLAEGCVFDVVPAETGSPPSGVRPALIAWMTSRLPSNWASAIDWQMSGVLVSPDVDMVTLVEPDTGRRTPIDETRLNIDGIVAAPFVFVGSATSRPNDSQLKSFDVPLPSPTQVGIQAERLK
jgi:hypothetical protein